MTAALTLVSTLGLAGHASASPDWADLSVPADAGDGREWVVDEQFSVDFNQEDKAAALGTGWVDRYINGWRGPGRGHFSSEHSRVKDGKLELVSRWDGPDKMKLGVASTTAALTHPVFVEARMKVSASVLSSNFWLLSEDDVQELDVVECYGTQDDAGNPGEAGANYHIFERDADTNDVIEDHGHQPEHFAPDGGGAWRDGFHRFGAYWKDAWTVEFYYDGKLVRTLTKDDINDPEGRGMDRPMRMILDLEDHSWRVKQGITPSKESLDDPETNRMWVDWVRVCRPR